MTGAIDVSVGDVVRVQGTVEEFFDLTRMSSVVSVTDCDTTGTATATPVTLPVSSVNDFEAFEGMAVIPEALVNRMRRAKKLGLGEGGDLMPTEGTAAEDATAGP